MNENEKNIRSVEEVFPSLKKIVDRLFTVKSIVTIILTVVFAKMCVAGNVDKDFLTIYGIVMSFYFGTQHDK